MKRDLRVLPRPEFSRPHRATQNEPISVPDASPVPERRASMPSRRSLVAVGLLALAVRLAYVLVLRPEVPFNSDAQSYHLLARNIADGRGYIAPYDWFLAGVSRPTAEFGPAHPALLSLPSLLGVTTVLGHQLFMAVVGSMTPVATAALGARVTARRAVGVAAGVVAAVHPLLFGSDGAIMSETTYTLLGVLVVLALLRVDAGARRWWAAAAGALVGLAVLTRGDGLLLLPLVVAPVLYARRRRIDRELLGQLGFVAAAALLVIAPWVARNAARFDGRLVLSNNVGSLLNGSNCARTYAGERLGSWDFQCAYRSDLPSTNEAENSRFLREQGLHYLRSHAERLPVVVPARVARGWGLFHPFQQARAEVNDARVYATQATGVVLDWVLLPLFVLGVLRLRREGRSVAALVGPLLLVTLLMAGSYGNSRFRELAQPALVIGATTAVVSWWSSRTASSTAMIP